MASYRHSYKAGVDDISADVQAVVSQLTVRHTATLLLTIFQLLETAKEDMTLGTREECARAAAHHRKRMVMHFCVIGHINCTLTFPWLHPLPFTVTFPPLALSHLLNHTYRSELCYSCNNKKVFKGYFFLACGCSLQQATSFVWDQMFGC